MKYYILLLLAPLFFLASCNGNDDNRKKGNGEGEAGVPAGDEVAETGTTDAADIGLALAGAIKEEDFDSLNRYILTSAEVELYYKETDLHMDEYDRNYYQDVAATIQDTLQQQFNRVVNRLQQENVTMQVPPEDRVKTTRMQFTGSIRGIRVDAPVPGNDTLSLSAQCIKVINNYYIFDNITLRPKD